jgi:hypothetical protein
VRRGLGIRDFDLDSWVTRHLRSSEPVRPLLTQQELEQKRVNDCNLSNFKVSDNDGQE